MMRAVSDLTKPYGVKTVASLNSIMVDATGMCGACMVPVTIDGKMVRKHACIDGPELDATSSTGTSSCPASASSRRRTGEPRETSTRLTGGKRTTIGGSALRSAGSARSREGDQAAISPPSFHAIVIEMAETSRAKTWRAPFKKAGGFAAERAETMNSLRL